MSENIVFPLDSSAAFWVIILIAAFAVTLLTALFITVRLWRKNSELSAELQSLKNHTTELNLLLDCVADLGKLDYYSGFFDDTPGVKTPDNTPALKIAENRSELLVPAEREKYLTLYRKFFAGEIKDFSINYSLPVNGQLKQFYDYARLISIPDTGKKKFILATMDISEMAKQPRELANADTIINAVFNNLPGHIFIKNMSCDFSYIRCNNFFSSLLQMQPSEITGKTDFDLFDHNLAKLIRTCDMQIAATHSTADNRWFFTTPDGKEHAMRVISRPLKQHDGSEIIIGFGIDVTRQERIAEKLRKRNKELRMLLAAIQSPAMLLDNKLNLINSTPAMMDLFPQQIYSSKETVPSCNELCSCKIKDISSCPAATAVESGSVQICKHSKLTNKFLHIKPMLNENGSTSCLAVTLTAESMDDSEKQDCND